MASKGKELEELLVEAGNRLLNPPSSVDELLPLLDQVENCLAKVEQSPSKSMQTALVPSMKALIADELLRHSDMDVKVTVTSCISAITRITAPDAPYDDEQMKEIFQLIVVAFEKLFDTSNRSYSKRVSILETVAEVRSCVVMLDLKCDALILEMFHHFLKAIRDNHTYNVFSSMETIMTLVLEESEDISLELLSPLLNSVKKDNQDVLPIAQKLGEKVIENCAAKLKPYMMQAVQSLGISFNDYCIVVASICQETSDTVDHIDANVSGKHLTFEVQHGIKDFGENLVGSKNKVWWPDDLMHQKKKAKTNPDSLNIHAKTNVSLKRAGGATKSETGKSKCGATKSGGKSKDDGKLNSKSKYDTSKIANKSKDDSGSKTKDDTPKSGNKLRGVHTAPSKTKDDSIKSGTKSKGETPKTTSKSSANGTTAKVKSIESKVQESEDSAKGSLDSAKAQEIKTKSGK